MVSVDQKETSSNNVEKTKKEIADTNDEKIETKLDSDPSQKNTDKGLSNTNNGGGTLQSKKEQTSNSQRKRRGGNGSRSNRGRRQAGKKGEWKKLDVEVSFNKNNQSGSGRRGNRVQPDNRKNNNSNSSSSKGNNVHSHNQQQNRRKHGGAGGRGGFNNRSNLDTPDTNLNWRDRKDKKHNKSNSYHNSNSGAVYSFPKVTAEQLESATKQAVKQVEFFFSNDELCRNTYLRNHMDVQGYLPAAIVFNFPSVVMYSVPYDVLLKAFGSSEILEIDLANETLRLKENYEKWLYPNDEGGFGCPRWIKQPSSVDDTAVEGGESTEQNDAVPSKALQKETSGNGLDDKNENSESPQNNNSSSNRENELNESAGEKANANKQNDTNTPDLCETDGESRDSM